MIHLLERFSEMGSDWRGRSLSGVMSQNYNVGVAGTSGVIFQILLFNENCNLI